MGTCNYNSKYRKDITYYGEGTSAEMCFGFLTYYPRQTGFMVLGIEFGELNTCDYALKENGGTGYGMSYVDGCQMGNREAADTRIVTSIMEACADYRDGCSADCSATIKRIKAQDPCYRGDMGLYYQWQIYQTDVTGTYGLQFLNIMRKCDESQQPTLAPPPGPIGAASAIATSFTLVISVIFLALTL